MDATSIEFAIYAEHQATAERRPLAEHVPTLAQAQAIARQERHTHGGCAGWEIIVAVGASDVMTQREEHHEHRDHPGE